MIRIITAFILSLILLVACGGGEQETAGTASAPGVNGVSDTEIVIGSHNDMSGPLALIGTAAINGARMRFDEANANGGIHGRKIRFIVEDTQYQVPRAIQAANKLVNRDKIFAMFLGMGTPMNNAILPMLTEKNIPNLFPISGARSMIEPFRKLQFIGRGIYYDEISAGTKYFIEKMGAATPCIVYQDTDFGQEVFDGAKDQIESMGMEVAAVSAHKPADTEFTATILRLRKANCDLVMMGTVHKDTILLLETARKMGWEDVSWVGTNASYSQSAANLESGASEGYSVFVHISVVYRDDPDLPEEVKNWWDGYVQMFGMDPEYPSMEGYRNADLVVRALEGAGRELSQDTLIAAMEEISDYTDLFGYHLSFSPQDHKGVKESALSTVVNGRWQTAPESISY
jgi:branched-chain amino acid transport system substrate-binding protein